jgi:hypothetical protein
MCTTATPLLLALALASPPAADTTPVTAASIGAEADELRLAQRERVKRRRERRERLSPEHRQKMRAEVERKMQTFFTVELSTRLGLDDKAALKLSSAFKAHRERKEAGRKALHKEYEALKDLLEKKAGDKALRAQTQKVLAAAEKAHAPDDKLFHDARGFLSSEQHARFVLSLPEVQREMHRMMRHARGEMRRRDGEGPGPGPGPGPHGPPPDDFD